MRATALSRCGELVVKAVVIGVGDSFTQIADEWVGVGREGDVGG